MPDLAHWLASHGFGVESADLDLPSAVAVLSERTEDARALVHVNPRSDARSLKETGLATALGHVLMDEAAVSIDGDWEHWPTSARARAFGVALTLPEEGVRQMLSGTTSIRAKDVKAIMTRFRSGPLATTNRLMNLDLSAMTNDWSLPGRSPDRWPDGLLPATWHFATAELPVFRLAG